MTCAAWPPISIEGVAAQNKISACEPSQPRSAAHRRRFHLSLSKSSPSSPRLQQHLLFQHSFALLMRLHRVSRNCALLQFARQQRAAHAILAYQTHLLFQYSFALLMRLCRVYRNCALLQLARQQRVAHAILAYQTHLLFQYSFALLMRLCRVYRSCAPPRHCLKTLVSRELLIGFLSLSLSVKPASRTRRRNRRMTEEAQVCFERGKMPSSQFEWTVT